MLRILAALGAGVALLALPVTAAHAYGVLGDADTVSLADGYNLVVTGLPTNDPATVGVDSAGGAVEFSAAAYVEQTYPVANNSFSAHIDFPGAGEYFITILQNDELVGSMVLTVAGVPDDDTLSDTGFNSMPIAWFGGGALVLGVALVATMTFVRRNAKLPTAV